MPGKTVQVVSLLPSHFLEVLLYGASCGQLGVVSSTFFFSPQLRSPDFAHSHAIHFTPVFPIGSELSGTNPSAQRKCPFLFLDPYTQSPFCHLSVC